MGNNSDFDIVGMRYFWAIFSAPCVLLFVLLLGGFPNAIGPALQGLATIVAASIAVKAGVSAYLAAHVPIQNKELRYFSMALSAVRMAERHFRAYDDYLRDDDFVKSISHASWLRYYSIVTHIDQLDVSVFENQYIENMPAEYIELVLKAKNEVFYLKNTLVSLRDKLDNLTPQVVTDYDKQFEAGYKNLEKKLRLTVAELSIISVKLANSHLGKSIESKSL